MNKIILTVTVFVAILLVVSCGSGSLQTTSSTMSTTITTPVTMTTAQTTTSTPINTTLDVSEGAPSAEELAELYFIHPELPRITCEKLKQLIDQGEMFIIIDVRDKYQYETKRIPQAISLPLNMKDEQIAGLLTLPKDKLLIFY